MRNPSPHSISLIWGLWDIDEYADVRLTCACALSGNSYNGSDIATGALLCHLWAIP
jgi:hypothetical protein